MNQSSPCAVAAVSPVTMTRGDTAQFQINVTKSGSAVNLTGASLQFVAQGFDPHKRCRISRTTTDGSIVVANPATGIAILTLVPSDTLPFPNDFVKLRTMWVLTDTLGKVSTLVRNVELLVEPTLLLE